MSQSDCCNSSKLAVYSVAIVGTFLIGYGLVRKMDADLRPPVVTAERTIDRQKILQELHSSAVDQLEHYGWVDQTRGITRLPIARATEMQLKLGTSAAIRSNLLARLEKATVPIAKAPEKPSQFE